MIDETRVRTAMAVRPCSVDAHNAWVTNERLVRRRRRRRQSIAVATTVALVSVLTIGLTSALGERGNNTRVPPATARDTLSVIEQAVLEAPAVNYSVSLARESNNHVPDVALDVVVDPTTGNSQGLAQVGADGEWDATFEFIRVGDDTYLRGDVSSWGRFVSEAGASRLLADKWVHVGIDAMPQVVPTVALFTDLRTMFEPLHRPGSLRDNGPYGDATSRAVEHEDGAQLFYFRDADMRPSSLSVADVGGYGTVSYGFSGWEPTPEVQRPSTSIEFPAAADKPLAP
ncbi:MAG: hypothetical protein JWM93_2242 [Frankiales bacterium]|nr:hypothetical protein [Frankiales bacterium]